LKFESPLKKLYKLLFARIFLANQIQIKVEGNSQFRDQEQLLQHIRDQVARKLREKGNWRKPAKDVIRRVLRNLSYRMSKANYPRQLRGSSCSGLDLGKDNFGRDVAQNLSVYANLLRCRGVRLHIVLVLGSRAKGRWKPDSDVDLVVIADDLPRKHYERWFAVRDAPINMGADICACRPDEFLEYLKEFRIMALDAVLYGKIVYNDGLWSGILANFTELESKYRLNRYQVAEALWVV
jgi:predicted nucleotidyltransferase